MLLFSLSSLLLGIAFAAPPGVITTEAIRRGLQGGYWSAFLVELGSLLGDATWGIIALSGGAFLVQSQPIRLTLGIMGVLFLLYLAFSAFRDVFKEPSLISKHPPRKGHFISGVLLSLANPFSIAFWLSVGNTSITSRFTHPTLIHYIIFLTSFLAGTLIWCFILAWLVTLGKRTINSSFFRWVDLACAIFLLWFALQLGMNTWRGLIQ